MNKICFLSVAFCFFTTATKACPLCNRQVRNGIYNSQFSPNLLAMLSAFVVLAFIVVALSVVAAKRHRSWLQKYPGVSVLSPVPLTTASTVLGIGLGGFIDGIVLHQILQVHEMLSNKIPATDYVGKSVNMFWDGIFHAFCLLVVLTGLVLLWQLMWRKDADRSGKLLAAGLLFGWGIFNIVEGIIDHQILRLHNVVEYAHNHNEGNYLFLGISVVMLLIGYWLVRSVHKRSYLPA